MNPIIELQKKIGVNPDGKFGPATSKAFARHFNLSNAQAAHLLGQCHHESGGFKLMEEDLSGYSAKRLLEVFPKYFDPIQAKYAANNAEAIANKVYANRMGNSEELSGDGYRHRGMGPLQLSGKENQEKFLRSMGRPIKDVHLIAGELAFESAIWFFRENNILSYSTAVNYDTILKVSRAVNVGNPNSTVTPHHLDKRINWTNHYYKLLTA
jgi:putative chitinase